MSMNRCKKCNRELKDQTASYGWRCAQTLGYASEASVIDDSLWESYGYRMIYQMANEFLLKHGYDPEDVDLNGFYYAMYAIVLAEHQGDRKAWVNAFIDVLNALYPGFDQNGNRHIATSKDFALDVLLDVFGWLSDLDLKFRMSRFDASLSKDYPYEQTDKFPRFAYAPIHPVRVEEYLLKRGEAGSYEFWTEPLDIYGGNSRMNSWTSPVDFKSTSKNKLSFNFGEGRPNDRNHAGFDIHSEHYAPIYAVTGGIVIEHRPFVLTTYQTTVLNFDGSIVRYTEIINDHIPVGTIVMQGDLIGHVGKMKEDKMLHIEVYSNEGGVQDPLRRRLTNEGNRSNFDFVIPGAYERRSDLINPSMFGALQAYQGESTDITKRAK